MNEVERQSLKNQQAILNGLLFCVPEGIEHDELWTQSLKTTKLLNPKDSDTTQKIKDSLEKGACKEAKKNE